LPIPEPLWAAAAELARSHGVCQTAQALRLEYKKLKQLADGEAGGKPVRRRRAPAPATFVELAPPTVSTNDQQTLRMQIRLIKAMRRTRMSFPKCPNPQCALAIRGAYRLGTGRSMRTRLEFSRNRSKTMLLPSGATSKVRIASPLVKRVSWRDFMVARSSSQKS